VVHRLKLEEEVEGVVEEEASGNDDDLDVSSLGPYCMGGSIFHSQEMAVQRGEVN